LYPVLRMFSGSYPARNGWCCRYETFMLLPLGFLHHWQIHAAFLMDSIIHRPDL
jgi:hypothetical protein